MSAKFRLGTGANDWAHYRGFFYQVNRQKLPGQARFLRQPHLQPMNLMELPHTSQSQKKLRQLNLSQDHAPS